MKNYSTIPNTHFYIFIYAFILFTILCLLEPRNIIWGDAGHYWTISLDFVKDGHFAFSNFTNNLRSYVFPFILHVLYSIFKLIKDDHIFYIRISNILILSIGLAFIQIPFFEFLFKRKISFIQGALYITIYVFFWTDFLYYPMTDSLAISIFMACVLIIATFKTNFINTFFLFFLLMSLVYIRPIYACVFPFFIGYFLYKLYKNENSLFNKSIIILLGALGVFIVMIPQILINKKLFNILSPALQTQNVYAVNRGLYLQQLLWGTQYQKYDVQINNNYYSNSVLYDEPNGKEIFENEQMNNILNNIEYLKVVFNHLPDYILIYYRHIFNALDLRYNQIYIKNIYARSSILAAFNYSLLFLFIIILLKKLIHFRWRNEYFFGLLLLLPCVFIIPTVVENRFFLPAFSLIYIVVLVYFNEIKNILSLKYWNIAILASFILFQYICFSLSQSAFQSIQQIQITP